MPDRISRDAYGLKLAEAAASRADCTRRQVGAVIVNDDGDIVATGYNGAPAGEPGCLSDGACPRGQMSYEDAPAGEGYEETKCIAIHAEVNAVIRAGRSRAKGATIYVTDEPCYHCSIVIRAAGIVRVVTPTSYLEENAIPQRWVVGPGSLFTDPLVIPRATADGYVTWASAKARKAEIDAVREALELEVAKEKARQRPAPVDVKGDPGYSATDAERREGLRAAEFLMAQGVKPRTPRVFTADDPEPTDVAAVRDRDGYVWRLREGGWAFGPVPYTWESITYYAPLTEVLPSGKDTQ